MTVEWRGASDFEENAVAAAVAVRPTIDASDGSVLLAFVAAALSCALWLQAKAAQVLALTRLSTSSDADVDTFLADYGASRPTATYAVGSLAFARLTAAPVPVFIPVGALVSTGPGGLQVQVTGSQSIATYSAALSGYTLPGGAASITVPGAMLAAGTAGNVLAGAITSFVTPITGIDTVTNPAPFSGGLGAASDTAARSYFRDFVNTRSQATLPAVRFAVNSVQQGLSVTIQENTDTAGNYVPGMFAVTVDDGSGTPSASLLASIASAINAVRPVGSRFAVQAPSVVQAVVELTITVDATQASKALLLAPVADAVASFIDALPVGVPLAFSRVAQIAYDVSPAIANVSAITINGVAADLGGGPTQVVKAGALPVVS